MAAGPTINDIREITALLSQKLGVDYSNYAFSFLRRRFAYLYNKLKVKNTKSFLISLKQGECIEDFNYYFPVEETELFRDPSFWRNLKSKIFPILKNEGLVFWLPEIVSAEELVSLIVVLQEEKLLGDSKIYCNINSEKRAEEIKNGKIISQNFDINRQNFKRLELSSLYEDYFMDNGDFTSFDTKLLCNVEIIRGHYFENIPEVKVGMTIFRNKMLYYNQKLQLYAEKHINSSVKKGSFLSLGIKERILDENENYFDIYDKAEQIYKVL